MPNHPWGASTPEMNAGVLETGSTSATWAAASAAWMGLASTTLATMGITGSQMVASTTTMSGVRSMTHAAATPPFLAWLGSMAGIAFKQAAIAAVVAESYGVARSSMIPSVQSINNRVREAAAEASNIFGQNTPLIAALNAEYGAYTMQNAAIGSTYGEVITAATLPVPIPPPPPLSNAGKAAGDAANAMSNVASQASGQASQAASQASSTLGQGSSNPASSMMGQAGQLFSAPMQAVQGLSSPMQGMQSLLSAPMQMFGSASGMGDLFGGGKTGSSFSPMLTGGGGGLPLGAGMGSGGGAGLGGGGGGGLGMGGGLGNTLASRAEASSGSNSRNAVLSGISAGAPTQERMGGVSTSSGGGAIPPGAMGNHGAGAGARTRGTEDAVVTYTSAGDLPPRRAASSSERDLFS